LVICSIRCRRHGRFRGALHHRGLGGLYSQLGVLIPPGHGAALFVGSVTPPTWYAEAALTQLRLIARGGIHLVHRATAEHLAQAEAALAPRLWSRAHVGPLLRPLGHLLLDRILLLPLGVDGFLATAPAAAGLMPVGGLLALRLGLVNHLDIGGRGGTAVAAPQDGLVLGGLVPLAAPAATGAA